MSSAASQELRRTEAEERFQRGLALARSQNWDGALAEFLASRELFPTRSATRNAAIALAQLGRHAECYNLYVMLLRDFASSMPDDQQSAVREGMRAALSRVAEIEVTVSEPGVLVAIDGQREGTTPMPDVIRVNAGTHKVSLSKAGFETTEEIFTLASGRRKTIANRLRRLSEVGTLVVREASARSLQLLIDHAIVGNTPWHGSVAPGAHAIQLRGDAELGTAPAAIEIKANDTTTLVLRAVTLDAAVRIEPIPSSASLFIDGVPVGPGAWEGKLPHGQHRVEAVAPGHLPFTRQLQLSPRRREVVAARLEPDTSSPLWHSRPIFYTEAGVGALFAASLGGTADSCDCSERSRPLGVLAGGRMGYQLFDGLSVELAAGYLSIAEHMTRRVTATGEGIVPHLTSDDYRDTTRLHGILASVGVAHRQLKKTPLTARAHVGLLAMRSVTSNSGRFSGTDAGRAQRLFEQRISIDEVEKRLFAPFVSTELRLGYGFGAHLSVDLGVALLLVMPPAAARSGQDSTFATQNGRATALRTEQGKAFVFSLPPESIAGPFVALAPSLGAHYEF